MPFAANTRVSIRVAPTPIISDAKKSAMSRSLGVEECLIGTAATFF